MEFFLCAATQSLRAASRQWKRHEASWASQTTEAGVGALQPAQERPAAAT
jgi:hypothetical protein